MRAVLPFGILLAAVLARPLVSQENRVLLEGILRAEDRRARGAADSALLVRALASRDTLLLRRAVRALGRLERPALAARILPLLAHSVPGMRAEAAQAVAQAAQGFRGDSFPARRGPVWSGLLGALGARVPLERDPTVRGMLALSLGRLPPGSPDDIARVSAWLLSLSEGLPGDALLDATRGMAFLARLTARQGALADLLTERLRALTRDRAVDLRIRRAALGGLLTAQRADSVTLERALAAVDPQLRRLAVSGAARLPAGAARDRLLHAGLADSAGMVRSEALGLLARTAGRAGCASLADATRDRVAAVALLALDGLGTACGGDTSVALLLLTLQQDAGAPWQPRAHALVSLARVDPARAASLLAGALSAPVWQLRMYAARAAGILGDSAALWRLGADPVANVQEAALTALHGVAGHAADALSRRALGSSDYQLVLSAANALAGSPDPGAAAPALLAALERISRDRRDTSRDPRIALLVRLRELGTPALAPRLRPLLGDFDPLVADSAAALLGAWSGRAWSAAPRPLAAPEIALTEIERLRGRRLRVTLEGGARFDVELLVDAAPTTVLRIARLATRGYYDGLSFHRVVPNFVIQGGSPGANEYAGAARFMRDELGPLGHERGTLGISTRGRDTGDGQFFVNLVDNPRLDYEYTVWGRVVAGMEVVDALPEGTVMRRVEIRPR